MVLKMPRVIFIRVGGTDEDPRYGLENASDVKACNGQNVIVADVKGERAKRTTLQRKAIQVYCRLLAEQFNDAGLDMVKVLSEKEVAVNWTMDSVKDVIWREIQLALFPDKQSSTQLEKDEVSKVYKVIARHMSERFNITQSFPNRFGD